MVCICTCTDICTIVCRRDNHIHTLSLLCSPHGLKSCTCSREIFAGLELSAAALSPAHVDLHSLQASLRYFTVLAHQGFEWSTIVHPLYTFFLYVNFGTHSRGGVQMHAT